MSVDLDDVDYIARLAKLDLSDAERSAMTEQLNRILGYMEQLQRLDVDDVPPTKHVIDLANVARDDEPRPSLERDEVLRNAPEADEDSFVVPRVLPDQ